MSHNPTFKIVVHMNDETLEALETQKATLAGLKAVRSTEIGESLIWFTISQFATKTTIKWTPTYDAYISAQQRRSTSLSIGFHDQKRISLGQTLKVGTAAQTDVEGKGTAGQVTIDNDSSRPWSSGIAEVVDGPASPTCSFQLNGHSLLRVQPMETVLLSFIGPPAHRGSTLPQLQQVGVLANLQEDSSPVVLQFDINKGWSSESPKATFLKAGIDPSSILIRPL